ncbi:Hypothetical Protein FCC1311_047652 [Hondaea fermentalgiana]|uniref:Uncharacterized protein n=1 Tax=Hondaea fermentalgiana TaxID=2315210 RepID=A0A2R5GC16_9STRA|nr:Hypothetical Protein FCC1311_047652 [Hondaea fermentalgiana]|eukprot:GBG28542.1 Hypothetical Protein FCC1311_047652 [Hondaea fermentalgiana]
MNKQALGFAEAGDATTSHRKKFLHSQRSAFLPHLPHASRNEAAAAALPAAAGPGKTTADRPGPHECDKVGRVPPCWLHYYIEVGAGVAYAGNVSLEFKLALRLIG